MKKKIVADHIFSLLNSGLRARKGRECGELLLTYAQPDGGNSSFPLSQVCLGLCHLVKNMTSWLCSFETGSHVAPSGLDILSLWPLFLDGWITDMRQQAKLT